MHGIAKTLYGWPATEQIIELYPPCHRASWCNLCIEETSDEQVNMDRKGDGTICMHVKMHHGTYPLIYALPTILALDGVLDDGVLGKELVSASQAIQGNSDAKEVDDLGNEDSADARISNEFVTKGHRTISGETYP